ncbi:DUF7919 family protein [Streptomyces sp. CO7]
MRPLPGAASRLGALVRPRARAPAPGPGDLHPGQGTGEIRVPGPPGVVFAAPRLVGHYVTGHGYRPPRPFVDAVLAFDPYGSWEARFPGVRFPWIPEDAVLRHIDDEGW